MANDKPLSERLLQMAIDRQVSERLGSIAREIRDFTKDMSEEDKTAARMMSLEMIQNACGEFYAKMKARIESKKDTSE